MLLLNRDTQPWFNLGVRSHIPIAGSPPVQINQAYQEIGQNTWFS